MPTLHQGPGPLTADLHSLLYKDLCEAEEVGGRLEAGVLGTRLEPRVLGCWSITPASNLAHPHRPASRTAHHHTHSNPPHDASDPAMPPPDRTAPTPFPQFIAVIAVR